MKVFKEFLESSTIHGLGYISTSKTGLEKLTWASLVLTGFSLAAYLIVSSYIAMQDSPVSTSISTHPTSSLAQSCKRQYDAWKGPKSIKAPHLFGMSKEITGSFCADMRKYTRENMPGQFSERLL